MKVVNNLTGQQTLKLAKAILLYESSETTMATLHKVKHWGGYDDEGAVIGPGRVLTREALSALLARMSGRQERWILPEHTLVADGLLLAWYSPERTLPIFFNSSDKKFNDAVNGRCVIYPPMLFVAQASGVRVFALGARERPAADSPLFRAPFFNLYGGNMEGLMCRGNVALPASLAPDSIPAWERTFFETQFTHSNMHGEKLTLHPNGHNGLWRDMVESGEQKAFPLEHLVRLRLTVKEVVNL